MLRAQLAFEDVGDDIVVDAAAMRLSAAIDSVANVSDELRSRVFPEPRWRAMKSTRNRIAHGYGFVDRSQLGKVMEAEVDGFEADVHRLIAEVPE